MVFLLTLKNIIRRHFQNFQQLFILFLDTLIFLKYLCGKNINAVYRHLNRLFTFIRSLYSWFKMYDKVHNKLF